MKLGNIIFKITFLVISFALVNCSSNETDENGGGNGSNNATLSVATSQITFDPTQRDDVSSLEIINLNFSNLETDINLAATGPFEISIDAATFSSSLTFPITNPSTAVFVRFAPDAIGDFTGILTISNSEITNDITIDLSGEGLAPRINVQTFDKERVAFGGGFAQTSVKSFDMPTDISNVETIKMYVQLTCPTGGCDEWDVFANVKVTDQASGERYEMARFITPYWNDNSQLPRGFEFDVTDFKSMLTGNVELRIRTECWNARGYEVSIDFDYIEGTPDYPYYAISRVFNYDNGSAAGIPYGVTHNLDLTRTINVPANAQSTHLRTIITGWGQAASGDPDGRTCAEWCFRTHDLKINGANMFQHDLAPLDCASNPVNNQSPGNWMPDRAGWCPGMEVPTRIDQFTTSVAGSTLNVEYDLEDWINTTTDDAYYPISTFVIVKSDTPISDPVVID